MHVANGLEKERHNFGAKGDAHVTHSLVRTFPSLMHVANGLEKEMNLASMQTLLQSVRMQQHMEDLRHLAALSHIPPAIPPSLLAQMSGGTSQEPQQVEPLEARGFVSYYANERQSAAKAAAKKTGPSTQAPGASADAAEEQVPQGKNDKEELSENMDAASIDQARVAQVHPRTSQHKQLIAKVRFTKSQSRKHPYASIPYHTRHEIGVTFVHI
jgi:hypothetical protein